MGHGTLNDTTEDRDESGPMVSGTPSGVTGSQDNKGYRNWRVVV